MRPWGRATPHSLLCCASAPTGDATALSCGICGEQIRWLPMLIELRCALILARQGVEDLTICSSTITFEFVNVVRIGGGQDAVAQ